jgi:hypothetical protein
MAKKFIFSPDDFNEYQVLKIPSLLYLILIYLNKYFLIVVLPSIGAGDLTVIAKWFKIDVLMMLSCFPALAVLIASLYRIPTPKKFPKLIWNKGLILLTISSALDLIVLGSYVILERRVFDLGTLVLLLINAGIIVYLWKSKYLKEMFKEFPEEIEKKK